LIFIPTQKLPKTHKRALWLFLARKKKKKKKNEFVDAVLFADDDDDDADAFEVVFFGAVFFLLFFFGFFSGRIRSEAFSNANTFLFFSSGCSFLRFE